MRYAALALCLLLTSCKDQNRENLDLLSAIDRDDAEWSKKRGELMRKAYAADSTTHARNDSLNAAATRYVVTLQDGSGKPHKVRLWIRHPDGVMIFEEAAP